VVDAELERAKKDVDARVIESTVCITALAAGHAVLLRKDLMEELERYLSYLLSRPLSSLSS